VNVRTTISIWFFIGILLVFYGAMITAYGAWEFVTGHTADVTLARLHAPLWWGAVLLVAGIFYSVVFRPHRGR
jgi:predicted metal-binding membrane protein